MKEVTPPEPSRIPLSFWIKVARGVGDAMQRLTYADDELLVSLGNSLKLHELSVRESRSLWGRLMGLFTRRVDPDSIEIDGMRLQQLFVLARSKPPTEINVSKAYALDLTTFRSLLKTATENLNEGTPSAREDLRD